jgi:FkbM family methyltransferase
MKDNSKPLMNKFFIEIGSCDFDTCHPLLENGWSGIMVEAVPEIALSLPTHVNLKIINTVISDYDGEIDFYVSNGNDWVHGISHVAISNHKGTKLLEMTANKSFLKRKDRLPCITLDTLIADNEIDHIDYLKLDVEGHETNIIESYSWKIKPTFIKLEHAHIDDIKMKSMLESQGYLVYNENRDMYAIY